MSKLEAAKQIIAQGNCEGIQCKDCPLLVENETAPDCFEKGSVVTQAKTFIEKQEQLTQYRKGLEYEYKSCNR